MMRAFAFLLLVLSTGSVCAQSVFGRTDVQKEIEVGRSAYEEALRSNLVSRNPIYVNRVNRIFNSLLLAMPVKLYPYQVVVIADNSMNAGCYPGGYIMVNEGLLATLSSDDAVAMVLAHEIGHGARRHGMRGLRKTASDMGWDMAVLVLTGTDLNLRNSRSNAHSRHHEREADAYGIELYLKAGFDPQKSTEFFEWAIEKEKGRERPDYLSTHPNPKDRLRDIQQRTKELLEGGLKPLLLDVPVPELALTSLFGEVPEVAVEPNPYFPLSVGAEWEFEVRGTGAGGYKVAVVGVADTHLGAIGRLRLSLGSSRVEYQCFTTEDAVYRRNRPEKSESPWVGEFVVPADASPVQLGSWTFARIGEEEIEVPAGRFSAVRVQAGDGTRELELWFVEGLGLVRRLNSKQGVDEVLVGFKKGKG